MNDLELEAIMNAYVEREGITKDELQKRIIELAETKADD